MVATQVHNSQEVPAYVVLTGIVEREGEQFVSYCPQLGTSSCGDTVEEAFANLGEAIEVNLNALEEQGTIQEVLRERHIRINAGPLPSEEYLMVPPDKIVTSYRHPIRRLAPREG